VKSRDPLFVAAILLVPYLFPEEGTCHAMGRMWARIYRLRYFSVILTRSQRGAKRSPETRSFWSNWGTTRYASDSPPRLTSPGLGVAALDKLMLNVLASFAEFERDLATSRIADGRAHLKAHGRRIAGAVPFG